MRSSSVLRIFILWASGSPKVCKDPKMSSTGATEGSRPRLVVFDLDYTLWPFWVDTHVTPPFSKGSDGKIYDGSRRVVKCYPDVPEVLAQLHSQGYKMAAASRTGCVSEANDLVRLFDWDRYFTYKEIYPGSKVAHFQKFHKQSGIPFEDMLFFDDEPRNIHDVSQLGVYCILAEYGVDWDIIKEGFKTFAAKKMKK